MSRHRRDKPDPVSLVLGPTAPGPFALLGLPAEDVSIQQVLGALHLRLEMVQASPHAATPAAEDVRLALHAAAAQLCDPAVRRLLLGSWTSSATSPAEEEPLEDRSLAIERDLHLAVGLSGGWNAAAMQRLALACESRGIRLDELGAVLAGLGTNRVVTPAITQPASASVQNDRKAAEPPRELLLMVGGGAVALVLIVIGLVMFTGPKRETASAQEFVQALEGGGRVEAPLAMDESKPAPTPAAAGELTVGDARSMERELAALAMAIGQAEGDAVDLRGRFEVPYRAFAANWHLLRRDETTAILSALIDVAFAAAQRQRESELTPILIEPLRQSPRDRREVRETVAAGATIARLLQERDLPRVMRQQLETALRSSAATKEIDSVARFELATEQIVVPLAGMVAAGPSWKDVGVWKGLLDSSDAALGDRARSKDAVVIAALHGLLRRTAEGSASDEGESAIALVASALTWEKTPELRSAVLGWFDDQAVATPRLAVVIRALVKSSVRGVDSTMTLSASASPEQRRELREIIESVLRESSIGSNDESVRAWAVAADALLTRSAARPEELIDLAARLSELVAARQALIDGQSDGASGLIASAANATALPAPVVVRELPSAKPNSKAVEYLSLGPSQAARSEFWKKAITQEAGPDLLLARTAIEEAGRGSPASVREAARDYVRTRANDDAIVLAALDLVFSIPESPENMQWLSDVAGRKIPWRGKGLSREAAHVALLDAVAARFVIAVNSPAIDAATERLANSWLTRAGEQRGEAPIPVTEAARRLATRHMALQRDARGSENETRRRLEARLAIARGTLQECVWWQAATVEMLAAQVQRRSPGANVRAAIEEWNNERRRAGSAFEQVLQGERAAVRLLRAEIDMAPIAGGGS